MKSFKSFSKNIFETNDNTFDEVALELFYYQASCNEVYGNYVKYLGIEPKQITRVEDIPFLPISFFKNHEIKSGKWSEVDVFTSSGTTGQVTSKHYVREMEAYIENTEHIFNRFYGDLSEYHVLALLPAYLERKGSSLVVMADHFIKKSKSAYSGFFLSNLDALVDTIELAKQDRKVLLLGVTFALLDLVEQYNVDLKGHVVMETGGMKGRRKEMVRDELHQILTSGFNVDNIHSEYGMTELLSQAYSKGKGVFDTPPWMKVLFRDLNDPLDKSFDRQSGGINVIDFCNVDTCAFIETQDLGRKVGQRSFEVIGRFDNSDIRGCNLMVL